MITNTSISYYSISTFNMVCCQCRGLKTSQGLLLVFWRPWQKLIIAIILRYQLLTVNTYKWDCPSILSRLCCRGLPLIISNIFCVDTASNVHCQCWPWLQKDALASSSEIFGCKDYCQDTGSRGKHFFLGLGGGWVGALSLNTIDWISMFQSLLLQVLEPKSLDKLFEVIDQRFIISFVLCFAFEE